MILKRILFLMEKYSNKDEYTIIDIEIDEVLLNY